MDKRLTQRCKGKGRGRASFCLPKNWKALGANQLNALCIPQKSAVWQRRSPHNKSVFPLIRRGLWIPGEPLSRAWIAGKPTPAGLEVCRQARAAQERTYTRFPALVLDWRG